MTQDVQQRDVAGLADDIVDAHLLDEMVQFDVALSTFANIDLVAIVGQARRDGIVRRRIGVGTGLSVDRLRLRCPSAMATRIADALETRSQDRDSRTA